VDKILLWDTGSTDNTSKIIADLIKLYPEKITSKQLGPTNAQTLPILRQKMLMDSECDWFIVLDGDEIWLEESIKKVINEIKTNKDSLDAIVVPFYNLVGDIYHYQR